MTIGPAPICYSCARFDREDEHGLTCEPFPDGIPHEIILNQFDHRKPHPDDRGMRFLPLPGIDESELDLIFDRPSTPAGR